MTLVKFANGQKNHAVNPFFNDVFDTILNDRFLGDRAITKVPAVNIAENENGFDIELAVPGFNKEDVNTATLHSQGHSPCLKA